MFYQSNKETHSLINDLESSILFMMYVRINKKQYTTLKDFEKEYKPFLTAKIDFKKVKARAVKAWYCELLEKIKKLEG